MLAATRAARCGAERALYPGRTCGQELGRACSSTGAATSYRFAAPHTGKAHTGGAREGSLRVIRPFELPENVAAGVSQSKTHIK